MREEALEKKVGIKKTSTVTEQQNGEGLWFSSNIQNL